MPGTLAVTGDADADALINSDPLALLIGMLLDQQVPMEWAFRGPATLLERLGSLDAVAIAEMEPDLLDIECRTKPAVHRYPSSMAKRIQALCQHIVDNYDGDASLLWGSATSGADLKQRLVSLPGYGDEKAMIFTAILAKRMGVAPAGWQDAAGPFSDNTPRSVADIDGPEALATVREWKKAQKAVGKSKQQ
ncbi:MAG TPA: HhH-GPD-type base excision DNA repair protein [Acidimicrobiales bacterium]|nr:HhH-GPD-type base excision DNA repair protein [Acidimicrobiales bacterium]MDP7118282.1 HhH-GPD-type base excision DNA repair protein [Acidimicrobiales bacterium]MDP7411733.1 HhH-GPD-type base excision DNA repair protein [Acidimicrobiales bacterium]MEE1521383.1 HhH-GPD-type base excision DNA repair protein [Acidimicrobiales bacterium]MEE1570031.1 HhH-GPD-type base excision DNA repair protein [Acidimicrobiales bacterium]